MKIPFIEILSARAADVPAVFEQCGIEYTEVGCVNWPRMFPYKPDFRFAIAHDGRNIFIHYKVNEKESRAVATEDMGRVWEDSCVEIFIRPCGRGYYNFECNCIGTLLEAYGPGREGREPAPASVLQSVRRWSSMERGVAFDNCPREPWEIVLIIPVEAFFKDNVENLSGMKASFNVYKCGDLLSEPHFISLAPVGTPAPDFHRSEYFTDIEFDSPKA